MSHSGAHHPSRSLQEPKVADGTVSNQTRGPVLSILASSDRAEALHSHVVRVERSVQLPVQVQSVRFARSIFHRSARLVGASEEREVDDVGIGVGRLPRGIFLREPVEDQDALGPCGHDVALSTDANQRRFVEPVWIIQVDSDGYHRLLLTSEEVRVIVGERDSWTVPNLSIDGEGLEAEDDRAIFHRLRERSTNGQTELSSARHREELNREVETLENRAPLPHLRAPTIWRQHLDVVYVPSEEDIQRDGTTPAG
ncbi:MAG: hypothetical protein KDD70_07785 [Bdellovibrionales bacterium]|nr:hypothetical protein [Bdellovibrionales bacterium]